MGEMDVFIRKPVAAALSQEVQPAKLQHQGTLQQLLLYTSTNAA